MCIECQPINSITIRYRHPIPCLVDLFDELYGVCVFSKIDLRSGYHQVQWLVMPFGLTNTPSTFVRMVNHVLRSFIVVLMIILCMLGVCYYCLDKNAYFGTLASPLNEIEKAFQVLKERLTNAPLLALPNFSKNFELECYASNERVEAMPAISTHAPSAIFLGHEDHKHGYATLLGNVSPRDRAQLSLTVFNVKSPYEFAASIATMLGLSLYILTQFWDLGWWAFGLQIPLAQATFFGIQIMLSSRVNSRFHDYDCDRLQLINPNQIKFRCVASIGTTSYNTLTSYLSKFDAENAKCVECRLALGRDEFDTDSAKLYPA
ncbi:hypothetical protein CR513_26288, partial [Mucuna pruriens]